MRKTSSLMFCLVLLNNVLAADFVVKNHYLSISMSVPPAWIVVTDSSGKKSGIDGTKPVDRFGQGSSIVQIPGSDVSEENIGSDELPLNQPQEKTDWRISFLDQPAQRYVVHLTGMMAGAFTMGISSGNKSTPSRPQKTRFLIEKGSIRTVNVDYDPKQTLVTITPVFSAGDFLKDTHSACGLGSIGPPEACEALESLAATVEKAKAKGDSKLEAETLQTYLSILNRLHNWGQKGYRQDWDDFKGRRECDHLRGKKNVKFFAKDPAYSALKLDAEMLLSELPKRDDGDHNKDGR